MSFFYGNNSAKPIAGTVSNLEYFGSKLRQATKLVMDGQASSTGAEKSVLNGNPVLLVTGTDNIYINGTNPDGLIARNTNYSADVTAPDCYSAFVVASDNDTVREGDYAGWTKNNELVNVALVGSGLEVWLAVDGGVAGATLNTTFDWADNQLKKNANGTGLKIKLIGSVVNGCRTINDNGTIKYEDCKVALFQL